MTKKKDPSIKEARLIFAKFLKKKRQNAGLTQKEVSDKLAFKNPQFISNIERGLAPVPFDVLSQMMSAYKISQTEVLDEYMKMQKKIASSQLHLHSQNKKRA